MSKEENLIYGFKCFNKGLTNRYGQKFEIGKVYHCNKEIKFGNRGHGFHIALRLEDTLKFFADNIEIAYVKCFGKYDEIKDSKENEYNDNYDMYAYEYMVIEKVLTREEIISYGLKLSQTRVQKFLMYFRLSETEKKMFREKFKENEFILNIIAYYQDGNKEVFNYKKIKKG